MQYFARLKLRKHSKCNILQGGSFENTTASLRVSKYSECYTLLGSVFEDEGGNIYIYARWRLKKTQNASYTMLRSVESFEIRLNIILCWNGLWKTPSSFWKHNSATLISLKKFQKTVDAILCWDGPPNTYWFQCFAQMSLCKDNSSNLSCLRSFKKH